MVLRMSFVAEARRVIAASPDACFARLADFPSWTDWMPSSFRPLSGPTRTLVVGDVLNVKIAGLPGKAVLRVVRAEPGRAIGWQGGVPGVLDAIHTFHFSAQGDGTLVHSEETWTGALTSVGPLARRVQTMAEAVGTAHLEALARSLTK